MSIQAYLEPRGRRLSGLTVFPAGGLGGGIVAEGAVLGGRMSLEEALVLDRIRGGLGEWGRRDNREREAEWGRDEGRIQK